MLMNIRAGKFEWIQFRRPCVPLIEPLCRHYRNTRRRYRLAKHDIRIINFYKHINIYRSRPVAGSFHMLIYYNQFNKYTTLTTNIHKLHILLII